MDAHALSDRTIGHRARQRLQASSHYDDLVLLGEIDRAARVPGVQVCTVQEALAFLRALDDSA
jgi:hypothetical protein